MKVFYQIDERGQTDYWHETESIWDFDDDPEAVAEDCARDLFANHDGWESSWPLTFRLFDAPNNDSLKATCVVDLEAEPVFYAREVTK